MTWRESGGMRSRPSPERRGRWAKPPQWHFAPRRVVFAPVTIGASLDDAGVSEWYKVSESRCGDLV
jgi:hypothetical protein